MFRKGIPLTTEPHPTREFLFDDQRPFAQCHASTLVETPQTGVLAAWFGGTREGHSDVAIWAAQRASLSGEPSENFWGPPRPIAKISDEPHWNPVLFSRSKDGLDLVLHFKVGERIRHWTTWVQHSSDAGESWSEAQPLVAGDIGGRGAVRNKPIRLASGDWLAGASLERWKRWDGFFDRSPNGIDGWVKTALVSKGPIGIRGKGLIQPTLWESEPGHVHALFRSTAGRIYRSDSRDDGRSWSRARETPVPNNNSGIDLAQLPDGTLALACNPVPGNWAARSPLSVLFSTDNGESFPWSLEIEAGSGEFSYPALIAIEDALALCYTWNRRRIAFRWISPDEIAHTRPDGRNTR